MTERPARILIVDDEPFNRDVLEQEIEDLGHEPMTAENGQQALERVAASPPDLILLDVMMPILDGFETCRRLKEDDATRFIPVIIMTALSATEDRIKGIEAGADDFLTKPVDDRELRARVQTALKLKHAMDAKLRRLESRGDHLEKFVPDVVKRRIAENPEAPELGKREQDVSIAFVDIAGYTKLSEAMSPEELSRLVESYFSVFLDHIQALGGDISETSGDGLMIVFHDDDPNLHAARAVEAVRRMFGATEELNARGTGPALSLHAGVNTGVAAVGSTRYEGESGARWTFTADGLAVNMAARIAGGAVAGEFLVGPTTAERIASWYRLECVGERSFKNIAEPVRLHKVVSVVVEVPLPAP